MFPLSLLLASLVSSPPPPRPTLTYEACRTHKERVDACFSVRARLSVYNGNPSRRLWPIGTKRLLGVSQHDEEIAEMPSQLIKHSQFETDVYGDFEVCPFTKQKEGWMQFVCIAEISNWRVVKN